MRMTKTVSKAKVYKTFYLSPIGKMILTSDGKYLTHLHFMTTRYEKEKIVNQEDIKDDLEVFKLTKKWLDAYFNKEKPKFKLPLKMEGSVFGKMVWDILAEIPYGQTMTYKEIALEMKKRYNIVSLSYQAVGQAVGHNPICLIVPCHRVVGTNGSLTGYSEGIDKKVWLLKHEEVDMTNLFVPKKGKTL